MVFTPWLLVCSSGASSGGKYGYLHSLPDHDRLDPETIRLIPLISATTLAFAAFASFGGNLFTVANVIVWLLAIAFFVYALWLPYRRVRREHSVQERRRAILEILLLV